MKVLQAKEPGVVEFTEEYAKPVAEGNMVVAKVIRNGICATDMAMASGEASFMRDGSTSYPARFGHECVGIVDEIGPDVKNFKVGDRIIVGDISSVPCYNCPDCAKGNYIACPNLRALGTIRTWPGAFADYVMMPEVNFVHVPEGISDDQAALVEPAAIGMDAVNKCNIIPGESYVLVTGVGAIGLAAAALAKWKGAKKVFVSGRTPYKLDIAKKLGADAVCNPKEEDLVEFVKRETEGHGIDCLIECSGNTAVLDDCFKCLAYKGIFVTLSFYERLYTTFDIDAFIFKEARMDTVLNHSSGDVLQAMSEGVDLTPLITSRCKFDEAKDMFDKLLVNRSGEIKVMVDFD